MHFFFGLSSTDLLWQVDAEHDIQTIRILSYLTLALGVYVCVLLVGYRREAGFIVQQGLLGKMFLLRHMKFRCLCTP